MTQFYHLFVTLFHCDIEILGKLSTINGTRHSRKMGLSVIRVSGVLQRSCLRLRETKMVHDTFCYAQQNDLIPYASKLLK